MAETMTTKTEEFATIIGPDAHFKGDLSFQGGVRIDGRFEGSITTSGKVYVSKGGHLQAEVKAGSLALEGKLEGNVVAEDRVELRASGQMHGDVTAAKLLVVEGAVFVGRCEVGPDASKGKGGGKPQAASQPTSSTKDPAMRPVTSAAGAGK